MISYTEDRAHPGGRGFLHAQQAADLIERRRDMHLRVVSAPPVTARVSGMVTGKPS
jgi:hypothetical protein